MALWHLSVKIFKIIYLKTRCLTIFICIQIQAKHLVISKKMKRGEITLFNFSQQNIDVELHVN